ncbi:MAG TPA: hemerythrin domain-containing protein [Actinomycetes bacterium]|nr:hemerythrin domain-containing protein [Actinomycetes bacterium]
MNATMIRQRMAGEDGQAERTGAVTDAAAAIVEVHAAVERAFARYDQAEGSHRRQYRALLDVAEELAAHTAVEQELLYPALRDLTGRHDARIERQLEQAHLIDLLLGELGGMIPSDRRYDAKVAVLLDLFREHARQQELTILPELRRRLDRGERGRLGADVLARNAQLRGHPAA